MNVLRTQPEIEFLTIRELVIAAPPADFRAKKLYFPDAGKAGVFQRACDVSELSP